MRLIPRDEAFFGMFSDLAKRLTSSARLLNELFQDPSRMNELVTAIKLIEHEADELTRDVIRRIDETFVTPIDREDIHLLASRLDDVIDLIDGSARRAQMFKIEQSNPYAVRMTEALVSAGAVIEVAVRSLKKPRIVTGKAGEVKQLEERGDGIYHDAMGVLFEGTPDPIEVIKWKELYDTLEDALDLCEDVANALESISLKNS